MLHIRRQALQRFLASNPSPPTNLSYIRPFSQTTRALEHFPPVFHSEHPELKETLAILRSKVLYPRLLNREQRKTVSDPAQKSVLETEDVVAQIGSEEVRLTSFNYGKDHASASKTLTKVLTLAAQYNDYSWVQEVLKSFDAANLRILTNKRHRLVRQALDHGNIDLILKLLQNSKAVSTDIPIDGETVFRTALAIRVEAVASSAAARESALARGYNQINQLNLIVSKDVARQPNRAESIQNHVESLRDTGKSDPSKRTFEAFGLPANDILLTALPLEFRARQALQGTAGEDVPPADAGEAQSPPAQPLTYSTLFTRLEPVLNESLLSLSAQPAASQQLLERAFVTLAALRFTRDALAKEGKSSAEGSALRQRVDTAINKVEAYGDRIVKTNEGGQSPGTTSLQAHRVAAWKAARSSAAGWDAPMLNEAQAALAAQRGLRA